LFRLKPLLKGIQKNGSLVPILENDGFIYSATRRIKWPGEAAVTVSLLHIGKGIQLPAELDGQLVERISAYLVSGDVDKSPYSLKNNPYFSKGSQVYGQGFLFDDTDSKASPLATLERLQQKSPDEARRVFPFIGGEELNSQPKLSPIRHAIYLSDLETEEDLSEFPSLREIVESKVKPERDALEQPEQHTTQEALVGIPSP
jgi:hypothetical protein